MEENGILGGRLEAMALLGNHMQQDWSVNFAHHLQVFFHHANIVAVNWSKIFEPKLFKHHAAMQTGFDAFFDLEQHALRRVAQNGNLVQHTDDFVFNARVNAVGAKFI